MNKKQLTYIGITLLVILISSFWLFARSPQTNTALDEAEIILDASAEDNITGSPRFLDNVRVPEHQDSPIVAVMIDANINARPHYGIDKAQLVIEAPVEGGLPRYMAFFDTAQEVEKIGPVRSARPYFLDWANEIADMYAHVGGSPAALASLHSGELNVIDLDEFYDPYFWRSTSRFAPHNVLTSSEGLSDAAHDNEFETHRVSDDRKWKFVSSGDAGSDAQKIVIDYGYPQYNVIWEYNPETDVYERYVGGKKHATDNVDVITAKNIVVQFVSLEVIDVVGRLDIETIGKGKALVFAHGNMTQGSWSKPRSSERTRYYDEVGNEVEFVSGMTWVQVFDENDIEDVIVN